MVDDVSLNSPKRRERYLSRGELELLKKESKGGGGHQVGYSSAVNLPDRWRLDTQSRGGHPKSRSPYILIYAVTLS